MLEGKLGELPATAPGFLRVDVVGATSQAGHSEPLATRAALEFTQPAMERTEAQAPSIMKLN